MVVGVKLSKEDVGRILMEVDNYSRDNGIPLEDICPGLRTSAVEGKRKPSGQHPELCNTMASILVNRDQKQIYQTTIRLIMNRERGEGGARAAPGLRDDVPGVPPGGPERRGGAGRCRRRGARGRRGARPHRAGVQAGARRAARCAQGRGQAAQDGGGGGRQGRREPGRRLRPGGRHPVGAGEVGRCGGGAGQAPRREAPGHAARPRALGAGGRAGP